MAWQLIPLQRHKYLDLHFVVGERYLVSCYVASKSEGESFHLMRPVADVAAFGHGSKIVSNEIRRVWQVAEATSTSQLTYITTPSIELGSEAGMDLYWYFQAITEVPSADLYMGGFMVEKLPSNTYKDGIALIGDSTMEGNSGAVDFLNLNGREISTWLGGILNVNVFNRANGGETTAAMDARWATDITPLAVNSKYVIIQGGLNDIMTSRPLADIKTSISSMNTKALADGLIPVFFTCTPAVAISADAGKEADRLALNLWLKRTYVNVIDIAAVISDPVTYSLIRDDDNWYGDGLHYGQNAKKAVAKFVSEWNGWDFITPSPYQKIEVSTYTNNSKLTVPEINISKTPTTSAGGYNILTQNDSTGDIEKIFSSSVVGGSGTSGQVSFWNSTGTQAGENRFFWDNTNKLLTINEPSPVYTFAKLHVNGVVASNVAFYTNNNLGAVGSFGWVDPIIGTSSGTQDTYLTSDGENLRIGTNQNKQLIFTVNGWNSKKMTIDTDGAVLIGTSTNNGVDKLQVNGTLVATSYTGSASLTGTPTAPTATAGTNTTQIATTAFVQTTSALNIAQTITDGVTTSAPSQDKVFDALALKANSNTPTFTGQVELDGGARFDNSNAVFNSGGTGLIDGISGAYFYMGFPTAGWYSNYRITAPVFKTTGYTVATLPVGSQGDETFVTDATAPTYLGTLTGGGSVVCPVFYNGTAWVSH